MILHNIVIKNFGVFRGIHEFNLKPDLINDRPIILFGGLNGSGKTTLFEGIKLCLYGRPTFKELKTKKQYHSYISKKVKPLKSKPKNRYIGSIEITFEFNDFGVKDIYSIRRGWVIEKDKVNESFRVLKNNLMIGIVERENSQSFVANIVPMGISNLFFFDGEKIQELADDSIENGVFQDALDSILGLDIIQTLRRDLKTYGYKENASEADSDLVFKIEKANEQIDRMKEDIQSKTLDLARIDTQLRKSNEIIQRKENELVLQGAGYAKNRINYHEKMTEATDNQEETRALLKSYYGGLFPFTLVPELCEQLQSHIVEESRRKNGQLAIETIASKKGNISKALVDSNGIFNELFSRYDKDEIVTNILTSIIKVIQESTDGDYHFINDFSEKDLNQLMFWVDQTRNVIPYEIESLTKKYAVYSSDRIYYENLLRKVPDDAILDPIVKEINSQYSAIGRYETQKNQIEKNIEDLSHEISEKGRQKEILIEKFEIQNKNQRKIKLLRNIRLMLEEYKDIIRESKMELLKTSFLDAMSMILRKHDFINDIQIDSNYSIKLQREDGNFIHKSMLSNGEKQIFAISMLLALARVSGRPLPFIIDTPLARLDSSHRDNIVANFFPNASHQVIIFSTDTEIDKAYFEKMAPHITRVYHLVWDEREISSTSKEGYFWKKRR